MKILYSAVGDTDPIRDLRDGAILHIVRWYQPDPRGSTGGYQENVADLAERRKQNPQ